VPIRIIPILIGAIAYVALRVFPQLRAGRWELELPARGPEQPAMVKINADGRLVVRRETIEELIGRDYDLQELQVNMITMSGNLDQTDDEITLFWKS